MTSIQKSRFRKAGFTFWCLGWLAAAGWFYASSGEAASASRLAGTPAVTQSTNLITKPIRDIQPIADRVLADNPETEGQAPSEFGEFNQGTWRLIHLRIEKQGGGHVRATLARPLTWIEERRPDPNGPLWLEVEELDLSGTADVLSVEACPTPPDRAGRLVTGKFEHTSGEVLGINVEGVADPIRTTATHPFWSEDRQEFVAAGKLENGERLRTVSGRTATVAETVAMSSEAVYNLEVDGEHVYFVSTAGVLVHNSHAGLCGNYGFRRAVQRPRGRGLKAAAGRLGISLSNIKIVDGVAMVRINQLKNMDPADIRRLAHYLKSKGATKLHLESGILENDTIRQMLLRRGRYRGGRVFKSEGAGLSEFRIEFDLEEMFP